MEGWFQTWPQEGGEVAMAAELNLAKLGGGGGVWLVFILQLGEHFL